MRAIVRDKKTLNRLNKEITIVHKEKFGLDFAIVSCSLRPSRKTYHSFGSDFTIYSPRLKLTTKITTQAMNVWKDLEFEPSLFNVQNAVNILNITCNSINAQNVKKLL